MTVTVHDTIGALAGLDETTDGPLRGHRPEVAEAAEQSLHALFDMPEHDEAPGFDRVLRLLTAARAAHVDGAEDVRAYYLEQLEEEADSPRLTIELAARLVSDGADGPAGQEASREVRALLRHIDLLVQRSAAATVDDLAALTASGWNIVEIVMLSQVITFVSYQTRVVHGLQVLRAASSDEQTQANQTKGAER